MNLRYGAVHLILKIVLMLGLLTQAAKAETRIIVVPGDSLTLAFCKLHRDARIRNFRRLE